MRGYNSRSLEDDGPKMVLSSRGARRSSDLDPPPYPASSEEPEISNSGACHAAAGGASGTIAAPRHAAGSHMRARERKAMKRPFTVRLPRCCGAVTDTDEKCLFTQDGNPLLNPEGMELLLLQGGDAEVQVQQAEGPSGAQRAAAARNGRALRHGSLAERSGHVVVPAAAWAQGAGLPQIDEASGGCGISALGMPMASTPLVASDQDSAGLDVDDLPQHAYAHSARMGAPRHGGGGGGGGSGGAHQPRHHRASSGSVASERGLAAAPVGEQVELEFRPTDMREEIAALQRALEMPSSVEDLQEGYKLPSDSDLAQCLRKRGKGGRNPAADARHDPNIDPKKAQRIMANRESAARSKFRQRLAAEGGRMKMDLLSSQKSKLANEIEELQELIQELEDAQVDTHSPGQPLWPAPGGPHDNGGAGGPHIKPNSPLSSNSNARPASRPQQQHQQHQYPQQHHHHPTHYQQHQQHPSMLPALCLAGAPASPQQQHPYHHHQYHQHPYHDPHAHAHGHGHGHGHGNGMLAVTRSLPPGMLQHALRRVKPSPSDGSQQLSDDEGVEGMGMGAGMGVGGMGGGMGGGGIGGGPLRMMSTPVFGLNELMSAPAELDYTKIDMRH